MQFVNMETLLCIKMQPKIKTSPAPNGLKKVINKNHTRIVPFPWPDCRLVLILVVRWTCRLCSQLSVVVLHVGLQETGLPEGLGTTGNLTLEFVMVQVHDQFFRCNDCVVSKQERKLYRTMLKPVCTFGQEGLDHQGVH